MILHFTLMPFLHINLFSYCLCQKIKCNGVKCKEKLQEISANLKHDLPEVIFWINTTLISKHSRSTMCTLAIGADFHLCQVSPGLTPTIQLEESIWHTKHPHQTSLGSKWWPHGSATRLDNVNEAYSWKEKQTALGSCW
jgi:hypothetical protein